MSLADALRQRFFAWEFRRRAPEISPIVLTQRRVYVLPTRVGVAYAAALSVMLLGAINYSLSLGYALVFLLAGLGVATILHTFRNLVRLEISPGRCEPVFVGETARFCVSIGNARSEARYAIRLQLPGQSPQEIDLPASANALPVLPLPARQRGWLPLPRLTIATTYPLALVRAWSYANLPQRCLVYPAPAQHAPPLPLQPATRHQGQALGSSGAEDFAGLRRHQPADPPRHVAWKTAARLEGPLLTKEFGGTSTQRLSLDWRALAETLSAEQKLSILARWVQQAQQAGASWSMRLPDRELDEARGETHYHACLTALALHDAPP